MPDFRMPSLGADMDAGTLVEWLVQPGDVVSRGDIVAVVETPKAAVEVEIWEDGVIDELLVEPGQKVPVGEVLATLTNGEASAPAPAASQTKPAEEPAAADAAEDKAPPAETEAPPSPAARTPAPPDKPEGGWIRSSPLARRRAEELGLDLSQVAGTGPGGAVQISDVERLAEAPPAAAPEHHRRVSPVARRMAEELGVDLEAIEGTGAGGAVTKADIERLREAHKVESPPAPADEAEPEAPPRAADRSDRQAAMRQAIAAAMAKSKREIPHYYLKTDIDMKPALDWLASENARRSVTERLLPSVLLLKAAALAVADVPEVNGFWTEAGFEPSDAVHLGVAISLRSGGLVAPAIHHADLKSLDELMEALRDLVKRARAGSLRSSELTDATLTITSLGDTGTEEVYGVIYPPQVGLVGFGRISERPRAKDGMLGVRPVVTATFSGDHRASDGHRGGLYLAAIADNLQSPEEL